MRAMATRRSLREALAAERPLVTPLAHDALSARLIAGAGFNAFAIGGSALLAARYGLPDIGLVGLADMVAGIRDIAAATPLPFFADGDDGYGDVKSVARMVEAYEALGVGAILIEDQLRDRKQQRAERALGVADIPVIEAKLRTALAARASDTLIIGRTDAFGVLGLDAAIARAERFLAAGVDGVFVAGLKARADYERVGRALDGALLSAAVFEGGDTPWLTPAELGAVGFRHVSFPTATLFPAAAAMHERLAALRRHADDVQALTPAADAAATRRILDDALELPRWQRIEATFRDSGAP
jgi:2-methylisocitrate lyase-like PEP mutase family enzyme